MTDVPKTEYINVFIFELGSLRIKLYNVTTTTTTTTTVLSI
jgi:hypothetical protein